MKPNFFPNKDEVFKLYTPDNQVLSAKLCQENSKALMTNPNDSLEQWLLRQVLNLKEGELANRETLDNLGIDSVKITKIKDYEYKIDISKLNSYEEFIKINI